MEKLAEAGQIICVGCTVGLFQLLWDLVLAVSLFLFLVSKESKREPELRPVHLKPAPEKVHTNQIFNK